MWLCANRPQKLVRVPNSANLESRSGSESRRLHRSNHIGLARGDRCTTDKKSSHLFEQSKSAIQRILIFLAAVIAAPMSEELVWRGYLCGTVKSLLGGVPALVLTGIIFAVVYANLASLLPLFLLACCLTLAYETTGSLWVPITMHAAFNAGNLLIALQAR